MQALVVDALEDVKAQDIKVFDTTHMTSLFDRVVVASGTSNRQTRALAGSVRDKVKEKGGDIISIEGEDTGEWVLVDLGDIVVHIMQPAIRAYYRLEEIWGEKEVKIGAAKRAPRKTSATATDTAEDKPKKTTRKAATKAGDEEAAPKTPRKRSTRSASTDTGEAAPAKKRAPRAKTEGESGARKTNAKVPTGKTVKVAASKTTSAARKAPAKRSAKA